MNGTLESIRFAIESVTLPSCGLLGLLGNVLVIAVLIRLTTRRNENRNRKNFDRMLISLSIFDSLLLITYITDAIIQADLMYEPHWYQVRFYIYIVNISTLLKNVILYVCVFMLFITLYKIKGCIPKHLASVESYHYNRISVYGCSGLTGEVSSYLLQNSHFNQTDLLHFMCTYLFNRCSHSTIC